MLSLCSDCRADAGTTSLPSFFDQFASALGLRVADEFKQHPRVFPLIVLAPDVTPLTSNIARRLLTEVARAHRAHLRRANTGAPMWLLR